MILIQLGINSNHMTPLRCQSLMQVSPFLLRLPLILLICLLGAFSRDLNSAPRIYFLHYAIFYAMHTAFKTLALRYISQNF